ncbi:MAG: extracellular solute-binding protein [Betaproteobacteria bacterium]|nr:extracellular solute-binding protein [Betaproteobacteria bacterium]
MRKFLTTVSAFLLLAGSHPALPVHAAPAGGSATVREIAMYQGADRHDRLVAAARREGELSIYHAYPKLTVVTAEFAKKYGIKVKSWRAGSEAILQRIVSESRGGRFDVDIVQNNAPETEALHREKLLQEVGSPYLADLIPEAIPAHKEWAGITLDVWSAAYNTNLVKKEDLPKSYQDLLDPKWKNRLGIEADDAGWFGPLVEAMGEQPGRKLFAEIVSANGISIRKGHSLLTSLVASGDVPFALTVYSWNPVQLQKKGAPVQGLLLQPAFAQFSAAAMLGKAPHPHAAALFYDYLLSEGQQLLADLDFVVSSRKIGSPFGPGTLKFVDPAQALDKQEKWTKMYEDILVKKLK